MKLLIQELIMDDKKNNNTTSNFGLFITGNSQCYMYVLCIEEDTKQSLICTPLPRRRANKACQIYSQEARNWWRKCIRYLWWYTCVCITVVSLTNPYCISPHVLFCNLVPSSYVQSFCCLNVDLIVNDWSTHSLFPTLAMLRHVLVIQCLGWSMLSGHNWQFKIKVHYSC